MTSSELLHFRKCDSRAWRVINNASSSSGFELAWESVVFRVFPAVFARLSVTQQRRRNARRLVHKVMKNGFEMLEKVRFFFSCTCQFSVNFVIIIFTLKFLSRKCFSGLSKKSSGHSRDILAFPCELWRWAALLVDGSPDFVCEAIVCSKMHERL